MDEIEQKKQPVRALVEIQDDKCKVCYACVRVCPVKAIQVSEGKEFPKIMPDRCIGCGSCIAACAPGAISCRDSRAEVREILASGQEVVAVTGPSISGEFADISDYRKFVQMIKALGFKYVHGSSFGVDLVAREYAELFNKNKGKYYLTTTCPVVVSYIEKYHPDLVPNLAPIVSPMIAITRVVRKKYGPKVKVVYIGPCIRNKDEALFFNAGEAPDAVITFVELRQLFTEFNISESMLEFSDFNSPIGYKGSLFPISNGLVQAAGMSEDLLTGTVITAGGKVRMLGAATSFASHINTISCHFNMFYCDGCIMGPGTSPNGDKYLRRSLVIDYANKRLANFNRNAWEKNMAEYGEIDFARTFTRDDQRLPEPDEDTIRDIMRSLDIEKPEDELGCNACGYPSCRDFAVSIAQGIASPEMCNAFSTKNKQNYIRTLKQTNEKLAQMQEALQDSERIARQEQEIAKEASAIISAMLQKIPNALVIVDKNLKILQSNESFIELVGDDAREINEVIPGLVGADLKTLLPHTFYNLFSYVLTSNEDVINRDVHMDDELFNISVFPIRQNRIVGAVIRDLSMPEVQKEEVINRVTDVIDKNLELVQKIGFILGEGASETEKMLNSIIESYKSGKKK
jgi:Na+-translocating ferredoxin:NAD+ oxidoreductase RNF subunit RnfB